MSDWDVKEYPEVYREVSDSETRAKRNANLTLGFAIGFVCAIIFLVVLSFFI